MIGQHKNNRILYHQNRHLLEKPIIIFFNPDGYQNYLGSFWKYKYPVTVFIFIFLQSCRYVSNEQPCLKTTGLYEELLLVSSLFHFFYFIFSALISFSLCFPISPSLLFFIFYVLSQVFIKHSRKALANIYK